MVTRCKSGFDVFTVLPRRGHGGLRPVLGVDGGALQPAGGRRAAGCTKPPFTRQMNAALAHSCSPRAITRAARKRNTQNGKTDSSRRSGSNRKRVESETEASRYEGLLSRRKSILTRGTILLLKYTREFLGAMGILYDSANFEKKAIRAVHFK
jgi:hypothetical protein